jgi:hypothetical protein
MAATKYYAWSELRNGGEVSEIKLPANKGTRTIVKSRNIVAHGAEVTQKGLGATDEEWKALIDGGSVRDYPVPDGADAYRSPARAFVDSVTNKEGDVDMDKLMAMGLKNPGVALPTVDDEEDAEVAAVGA